jgi:hypothetical protein
MLHVVPAFRAVEFLFHDQTLITYDSFWNMRVGEEYIEL